MKRYIQKVNINRAAFKSVSIYAVSNFLTKAVSFASLPLFTYLLEKKDFGVISIFSSSMGFLMPFISLSILFSTGTDFFKMPKNEFASFMRSTALMPVVMSVIAGIVFYVFFPFFKTKAGFLYSFIFLVPIVTYCNFLYEQLQLLIRNNKQPTLYLLVNVSKIIIDLGIAFLLIGVFHWNWLGRVTGIVFSFIVAAIVAGFYFSKNGYFKGVFDYSIIKNELRYSFPSLVMQFSIIFLNISDRFFINFYLGPERTGVYSIAATFASVIFIFDSALAQYIFPKLFSSFAENKDIRFIKSTFLKYLFIMISAVIVLTMFTFLCFRFILKPTYYSGFHYYLVLVIAYLIWAIAYFFYSIMLYHKERRKMFLQAIASILICAILINYFSKYWSETGATIAVLLSYSFALVLTLILNFKRVKHIFF